MDTQIHKVKIEDLIPDDANMNKGCEYGQRLVENSVRQFGAGRSILIDKNNRIIAGNKFTENAADVGLEDVIIVETTGNQIVAVKRTDVDLDTPFGREMAAADNACAKNDIVWDGMVVPVIEERYDLDLQKKWGIDIEIPEVEEPEEEETPSGEGKHIIVKAEDPYKLQMLYEELKDRGFDVKINE